MNGRTRRLEERTSGCTQRDSRRGSLRPADDLLKNRLHSIFVTTLASKLNEGRALSDRELRISTRGIETTVSFP